MASRDNDELTERQREILQAVVEDYIASAEPVGSRTLTKRNALDVSPATVRNAMADLEESGYLSAPHASAGRIPTPLAFRVYLERLAQRGRISVREREVIQAILFTTESANRDLSSVLQEAGRVLSGLSNHAALVLMPSIDEVVFADVEFIPVRERTVLAILVAKSGLIQQRLITVDFPVDRDELRHMANYLKSLLGGKTLAEVRSAIVQGMKDERAAVDEIMRHALQLGERTLASTRTPEEKVLVEGQRALFDQPEFADIGKMRKLLRAFEEKTMLLRLLDAATVRPVDAQAAEREDTQVVLGAESGVRELKDLAVVMASYGQGSGASGQVGVVGPIRMDYSRVIPLVEYTAGALSRSLGGSDKPGRGGGGDDDKS